jgi:hypothetical protein
VELDVLQEAAQHLGQLGAVGRVAVLLAPHESGLGYNVIIMYLHMYIFIRGKLTRRTMNWPKIMCWNWGQCYFLKIFTLKGEKIQFLIK